MEAQANKLTRKVSDINSLVNTYYILAETLDMMIREMEAQFNELGKGVKHNVRQRHTEMMRLIRLLKTNQEKFIHDYEAFKGDWQKYDDLRNSAAYISRIMLLIADRTNDSGKVENEIEAYLRRKKTTGVVSDELLNKFYIR
jgi:ribosomal protein L30/L7E